MGQYYKPICLENTQYLLAHDYDNGLKLMEHSWIENDFMNAVVGLIKKGGAWYNKPIVWAGDYADDEPNLGDMEPQNLYMLVDEANKVKPKSHEQTDRYLVNMDTKEFVDMKKVPVTDVYNDFEFRVHPLSLLTCEGNGQGGGDYFGEDENNLIGSWARNRVTVNKTRPKKNRGYNEIIFDLKEL